ncbi:radical SAM family heme chaperone HemW [Parabacteroides sp. PF5-6]|uniref:radical SAM family heme chaperone HemW n=1 Tax=Parabacteroides sp. PF5-6 TaxID=1742403 RepID=UPI0024050FBF|nr:radical SAM family heme chaperone HemW [Parabacteroides sp. PF5-6]
MSGLYIHIPFCARRCLYCDFFSHTDMSHTADYLEALSEEIRLRHGYLAGEPVETIYFGGGTPSQLRAEDFSQIFEMIGRYFDLSACREVTLEANPDDLSAAYLQALRPLPFNRISMGVQSFDPEDLLFLQRRHDREQALRAVALCQEQGYTNISIDLIYGLPGQTADKWKANLDEVLRLDIPHISAYHLIYEEGTALHRLLEQEKVKPLEEEESLELFSILIDTLAEAGYRHYEISNFARPGYFSQHNRSYWQGKKYLGLGPSAHSYNGESREWNVSSLPGYMQAIRAGKPDLEREILTVSDQYNDYIITRLRTSDGIDLREIASLFGADYQDYCYKQSHPFLDKGLLVRDEERLRLTRRGIFLSDSLMRELIRL